MSDPIDGVIALAFDTGAAELVTIIDGVSASRFSVDENNLMAVIDGSTAVEFAASAGALVTIDAISGVGALSIDASLTPGQMFAYISGVAPIGISATTLEDIIANPLSTQALSRVILQYRSSTRFLDWIRMWAKRGDELWGAANQVAGMTGINNAFGNSLDVLGEIVGVGRVLPNTVPIDVFNFEEAENAYPFGDDDVPGQGARFFDEWIEAPFGTTVMSDDEYRAAIRLKIARNHAKGTLEDMLVAVNTVMAQLAGSFVPCYVEDTQGMTASIYVGKFLTQTEKALLKNLNFLPKPLGVQLNYYEFSGTGFFGFEGQTGAAGFGDENVPGQGGTFAEEF